MLPLLLIACEVFTGAAPSASLDPPAGLQLVEVARVASPTAIAAPPGPGTTLYVTEQAGRIWRLDGARTKAKATRVLDISDRITSGGETGLLGLAFHPQWPEDPRIFVNYTHKETGKLRTRIASFRLPTPDGVVDPASEVEILGFDQPYSNHNSGALVFGPDGMLYVGVGDGGSGGDPQGHGQNLGDWLGSLLRVDVSATPYGVPPDNPFVGREGALPEIWAYGVRNPWGMHFDGATLWFADVGQNTYEEINRGEKGANYGWNRLEASHCFKATTCDQAGLTPPVTEYDHTVGNSVTGGLVYRGPSIPVMDGRYVFADFATGVLWALPTTAEPGSTAERLGTLGLNPSTFGEDGQHQLYIGDYGGKIVRVAP